MKITQSQKSQKFTISNITDSQMMNLWYMAHKCFDYDLASDIIQALRDTEDEHSILQEYGYDIDEYMYYRKANYATFKAKYPCYLVYHFWDRSQSKIQKHVLDDISHEIKNLQQGIIDSPISLTDLTNRIHTYDKLTLLNIFQIW